MDWRITRLEEVASTMDWAREQAGKSAPDLTGVLAAQQTKGRGRLGHHWDSPEGNFYFSFIMRIPGEICGLMSLSLALALHDALRPLTRASIELKWPNDVLVDGRKIAGILIEMEGDAALIGIGVNILHGPPGKAFLNEWHDIDAEAFLPLLLAQIETLYKEADPAKIVTRWNDLAAYKGREISFLHGRQMLRGVFEGVDENGHARIRDENGTKTYASGEVMEVRPC